MTDERFVIFGIRHGSRQWVDAAESATVHRTDITEASELLSNDLMRWSRWWLGLGAFSLGVVASAAAGSVGMMLLIDAPSGNAGMLVAVVVLTVAIAAVVTVTFLLWCLHRSGLRLARALRWWLTQGSGAIPKQAYSGWIAPRAALFDPAVLVRVLTSTLSGLVGVFGFSLFAHSLAEDPVLLITSMLWGLLGTACCVGQMGGVIRLVNGLAEADPLWSSIRGR